MRLLGYFVVFYSLLVSTESANILAMFQFPYFSHQNLEHKIIEILLEEGHKVTVFATLAHDYRGHPNVTQHVFPESIKIHGERTDMLMYKKEKHHWSQIQYNEINSYYAAAQKEMEHPEIQKLIHNSSDYHFDLVITECIICTFYLFAEVYDCPIAVISSVDAPYMVHSMFGNDVDPFKHAESLILPYVHGKMSLWEKINSLTFLIYYELVFNCVCIYENVKLNFDHFSHLGLRSIRSPTDRLGLLMANTNAAFGHVRALMPHSIQIGFLHVEKPKEINDLELMEFFDNSKNGVIIMAFGSRVNTKSLGIENVKKFMNVFRRTNMNVLWKLDGIEDEINVPQNVKIVSWLPLADALAHRNVKLLIFHGGLCTAYEAIDREVPMIAFPLAYDQFMNARLLAENGIGMEMDLNNFDELKLNSAIQEMMKPKYVANVRRIRSLAYDQPISQRDLIVWHVNNAINNRIVYAKHFGSMSIFGSPLKHLLIYVTIFVGSLYVFVKRRFTKVEKKFKKM